MNAHLKFLLCALCALFAWSADAATNGIFYLFNYTDAGVPMPCGNTAAADDLWEPTDNDNSCGRLEKPCLAGLESVADGTSDDCGTCYALTFSQSDETPSCDSAKCPEYKRTIMVKIEGGLGIPESGTFERKFDLNYLGWIELCPFMCVDGPCVESATDCDVVPDEPDFPGSAQKLVPMAETAWQLVDCDSGDHVDGAGNSGGDFTVGAIPGRPTTTIEVTETTTELTTTADGGTNAPFTGTTETTEEVTTSESGAKGWGSRVFLVATFASLLAA